MALLSPTGHRILRIALVLVMAGGVGLLSHRLRRSEEQLELTRYGERELPPLVEEERAIADELSALLADQSLPAPAARKRLVDEITPRLVKLRRRAEALSPTTVTVRQLAGRYLVVLDSWTEAARTAVRVIDDPGVTTEAGLVSVRERLREAASASRDFGARVVETCEHHHLAPPRR